MKEFHTLAEFAIHAKARALVVETALEFRPKMLALDNEAAWNRTFLNPDPNEDECAFCRAISTCPAARAKLEATVGEAFDAIDEAETPTHKLATSLEAADGLGADVDDYLGKLMSVTGFLEDWIKAVRAEVERRLLLGEPIAGYGLELGRQGNRAWKDPKEVTRLLREQFRIKLEDAFDLSLKSPTSIEKMTKGKDPVLTPIRWKKLQALVMRSDAVPSVKPIDKIKEPYSITKPDESAFETIVEGDDTPLF